MTAAISMRWFEEQAALQSVNLALAVMGGMLALLIASDLLEEEEQEGTQVLTTVERRRSRIGQLILLTGICAVAALLTF